MNSFSIKQALDLLLEKGIDYEFFGDDKVIINNATSIDKLTNSSLSFCRKNIETYKHLFNTTNFVVLKNDDKIILGKGNYIFTKNPSLAFNIIGWMLKDKKKTEINKYSTICKYSKIGKNVSIGAFCSIGTNVSIGDNCIIQDSCTIKNAIIGSNTIIQSGVKIGSMGLGSYIDENGNYYDFPHFGQVIIGNNVVIQNNTVINRGTLNNTIIGDGTRIGPLCCIAHGVHIGKSCFISQSVTIAGSVLIGDSCKIWGNATLRDGIRIGDNNIIGMGAVVTKDILNNEIWVGNPARMKN